MYVSTCFLRGISSYAKVALNCGLRVDIGMVPSQNFSSVILAPTAADAANVPDEAIMSHVNISKMPNIPKNDFVLQRISSMPIMPATAPRRPADNRIAKVIVVNCTM